MLDLSPFQVVATTGLRQQDIAIVVTPSEETELTDLKQGDSDPVIKWNFAWSFEKKNYITR